MSIARQIALKRTCFCICSFLFWLALLKKHMILVLEYCWNCCIPFLDLLSSSVGLVITRAVFFWKGCNMLCFILLKEECIWHAFKITTG